jgi:hypothetical protein
MIAFHNDPNIKAKYLHRVEVHAAADEIIHGKYWERGKGCAVGCTIHSGNYSAYETEMGIPIMLASLEDRLFEGMENEKSKKFPARFLSVIQPGADLSRVGWIWLHWLLTEELASRDDPRVAKEIKACADVLIPLTKGEPCDRNAADLARLAVIEARGSVWNSAAACAAAAYAACAACAADASAYAACAAAYAYAACAACAAYASAERDAAPTYERMAEKLLQLMADAPLHGVFTRQGTP